MTDSSLARELRGKRVGLVLSAGFFGFFGHAGFLAAVEGAGLSPTAYAGTSAGALVASLAAAGLDAHDIATLLGRVRKQDFWDPAPVSALLDAARGRSFTGLLAGLRFRRLLDDALPVERIEQTPKKLVLVTTDVTAAAPRIHTEGPLSEVIHASCAYPGLFRAVPFSRAQLWDGGLVDKAPILALAGQVELDAILVHYLPGKGRTTLEQTPEDRWHGYVQAMARGLLAVRHENYELQGRLCEARGLPVYVVSPQLPRLSPGRLKEGRNVIAAATAAAARALAAPAAESRPFAKAGGGTWS
ncbi:patatin-like phospholipase family protein [Vulgatibacter sp.]|uniref:patatin-like phospholipase family protein n=1 Tax=Vulgatibacter sp. TaxID=1971226 RepID=UPI00356147D6